MESVKWDICREVYLFSLFLPSGSFHFVGAGSSVFWYKLYVCTHLLPLLTRYTAVLYTHRSPSHFFHLTVHLAMTLLQCTEVVLITFHGGIELPGWVPWLTQSVSYWWTFELLLVFTITNIAAINSFLHIFSPAFLPVYLWDRFLKGGLLGQIQM